MSTKTRIDWAFFCREILPEVFLPDENSNPLGDQGGSLKLAGLSLYLFSGNIVEEIKATVLARGRKSQRVFMSIIISLHLYYGS